jgi:glucose/arabinose dehydrogenase
MCFLSGCVQIHAQSGFTLTPSAYLNLHRVKVAVPLKFARGIDTSRFYVNLPKGYKARIFYAGGLGAPRFMSFSPSGVLHVSDMGNGKVYALPDKNNDGMADTIIAVASGFSTNHDVKFYGGAMYVSEPTQVNKLLDNNGDGIYESRSVFISNIPNNGGHVTRTMVFDSINKKMYLSIGSSCNVCRETNRAIIQQYNDDGSGKRTYAYGARNAVGMMLHPVTNRLWADNNGSDNAGDEVPPEWVDLVRDSGFYGHPLAYADKVWFDFNNYSDYMPLRPITRVDTINVNKMIPPAALIRAHSAPLALQFLNGSFPQKFRNGMLIALHGSWNSHRNFRGYKIVYLDLSNANDTTVNYVGDFCTGFLTDTINRTYWGRPTGLAVDQRGNIYMTSDDSNKFVMQIYPEDTSLTSITEDQKLADVSVYPNPFNENFRMAFLLTQTEAVTLSIWDVTGKLIMKQQQGIYQRGRNEITVSIRGAGTGIFFYELQAGEAVQRGKLVKY